MDGPSGWLQQLSAAPSFFLWGGLFAVTTAAFRLLLQSRPRGQALRAFVHGLEGSVLALLLAAMIVLSFLQVLLRNLFDSSLLWIDPLLRHLVLWVGLLGAALASRAGRHINVDALSRLLGPRLLRGAHTVTNVLAAVVTLLLAHACLKLVLEERAFPRVVFLSLQIWQVQLVMPVAMLLMSSRFLGQAVDAARGRGLRPALPEVRG